LQAAEARSNGRDAAREKVDSIWELSALSRVPASLFPLLFPFVPFVPCTLQLYENVRKTAFFPQKKISSRLAVFFFLANLCGAFRKIQKLEYSVVDVQFLKIFVLLIRQKTRENLGSEEMSSLFITICFWVGGGVGGFLYSV
jgi:hypothetical protein